MSKVLLPSLALMLLSGCAGNPKYACGLPEGVGCKPVGDVYEASISGTLARSRLIPNDHNRDNSVEHPMTDSADAPVVATVQPGDPLLTRPQHIRVWIDRWEDTTGDLHDETYLYLRLDNGTWRLGQ